MFFFSILKFTFCLIRSCQIPHNTLNILQNTALFSYAYRLYINKQDNINSEHWKKKTKRAIIVGPSASAVEHFHYSGRITDDDYMFECAVSMNRKLYAIEGILPTSTDLNYLCLLVIAS